MIEIQVYKIYLLHYHNLLRMIINRRLIFSCVSGQTSQFYWAYFDPHSFVPILTSKTTELFMYKQIILINNKFPTYSYRI